MRDTLTAAEATWIARASDGVPAHVRGLIRQAAESGEFGIFLDNPSIPEKGISTLRDLGYTVTPLAERILSISWGERSKSLTEASKPGCLTLLKEVAGDIDFPDAFLTLLSNIDQRLQWRKDGEGLTDRELIAALWELYYAIQHKTITDLYTGTIWDVGE